MPKSLSRNYKEKKILKIVTIPRTKKLFSRSNFFFTLTIDFGRFTRRLNITGRYASKMYIWNFVGSIFRRFFFSFWGIENLILKHYFHVVTSFLMFLILNGLLFFFFFFPFFLMIIKVKRAKKSWIESK